MKKILFLFIFISAGKCLAQEFSIKTIELTGEQLVLHYDLVDTTAARTYSIYVYSSADNFLSPLLKVTGDQGLEVKPGLDKRIFWRSKEELGAGFTGNIQLEIRGRVFIPFIRFEGFSEIPVRKRTVPFLIKWSGGTRQNILNFQLYQGEKLVYTFANIPNDYEHKMTIPVAVKPGKDYYMKITDTRNKDQVVTTSKFEIRRKIPLAVKVLPLVVIGATAPLWIKTVSPSSGDESLIGPPGNPKNPN